VTVTLDGTSTLGQVVHSLGVPLTEVGRLLANNTPVAAAYRPRPGDVLGVEPAARPQPTPTSPPRFVLDVHLGTLARRMRLLGLDTAYRNDASDDELLDASATERRVLLTQDRGLLRRRAARHAAYVWGADPDDQLRDVLDRFRPPLGPLTRCVSCNGSVAAVAKAEIVESLQPGTRRCYEDFVQCRHCGKVYWRGAHARRIDAIIKGAISGG
jgi:uncharacterized protein